MTSKRLSLCFVLLAGLLAGCVDEDGTGERYRAERDLWHADRARQELPGRAGRDRQPWTTLASTYEAIAQSYDTHGQVGGAAAIVESIVGRALLSASGLHAASYDSIRAQELLEQLAARPSLPVTLAAEVAVRRAAQLEREGRLAAAISAYEAAIAHTHWSSQGLVQGRLAASLLEVPLRLSRLHTRIGSPEEIAATRAWARQCYEGIRDASDATTRAGAAQLLADLAVDEGRWDQAIEILDALELDYERMDDPQFDPNVIRRRTLEVIHHAWVQDGNEPVALDVRFGTLLETDPIGRYAGPALLDRARALDQLGQPQAAIDIVTELLRTYRRARVRPEARLLEARIQERTGRWRDALVSYRTVHNEFPLEPEGLMVAVEVARHHLDRQDWTAASEALREAEQLYREVLHRFPAGPHTQYARARLVETLELKGQPESMLHELIVWSDTVAFTAEEIPLLLRAGRLARVELGDRARAIEIYDRLASRFPGTRTGLWSAGEVDRLRRASELPSP